MKLLNKKLGETPLELIKRSGFTGKSTYAGRLDPLAEGLMIILEGDEVHEKHKYLSLDKKYRLEVLFGISTDSYDILGEITDTSKNSPETNQIISAIKTFPRSYTQSYPPYSSKTVNGKPLWQWAKKGRLDEINIPTKQVEIHDIKINKIYDFPLNDLKNYLNTNITKVTGDFRQREIINKWEQTLNKFNKNHKFKVLSLDVHNSSGTYMRSIANKLGEMLKTPALALKINRYQIGEYTLKD